MKQYLIKYPRNFNNEYSLRWAEKGSPEAAEAIAEGYEPITRAQAIEKCRTERWARKTDPSFSGYGSSIIIPYGYESRGEWEDSCTLTTKDGYIYE